VGINDFRSLLIQLFTVSIFWTHFKKADEWQSGENFGNDAFNGKLDEAEFVMAAKSFCAAYGQEQLDAEQLKADFRALDVNSSGTVSMLEICTLCGRFIDPEYAERMIFQHSIEEAVQDAHDNLQMCADISSLHAAEEITQEVRFSDTEVNGTGSRKRCPTSMAMDSVVAEVNKNANIAELFEMKMATEELLLQEGL
jgi:hypothetical protein